MANEIGKKIGYLKGLLEGAYAVDAETQRKLFSGILEALDQINDQSATMNDLIIDLNDYVESIDDDLSLLEDGEPAERDEDREDAEPQRERRLRLLRDDEDQDDDEDEAYDDFELGDYFEVGVCPECHQPFLMRVDLIDVEREVERICPYCGRKVLPEEPGENNMKLAAKAE